MFALLLVGCGRHHGSLAGCETAVDDPTLQDAWDAWIGAVGPDRVCVGEVRVEEGAPYSAFLGPYTLRVDPSAADQERALRHSACTLLNDLEDILDERPEAYLEWKYPEEMFLDTCSMGPPTWDMTEEIGAACGESPDLAEVELITRMVYPKADYIQPDPMTLIVSDTLYVSGPNGAYQLAGAGNSLLVGWCAYWETPERCELERVDTSGVTPVAEVSGGGVFVGFPFRGPGQVLAGFSVDGAHRGWRVTEESAIELDVAVPGTFMGALSGDVIYSSSSYYPTVLDTLDLTTAATGTIALPDHPDDLVVGGDSFMGVQGGFVLAYTEAEVEEDGDMTGASLGDSVLARYDSATDTWTELARGLGADLIGVDGDRVVGVFGPDTGISQPGAVLGAWDLGDGRLLAQDTRCALGSLTAPQAATDGTAWWATQDADHTLRLEAFTLSE